MAITVAGLHVYPVKGLKGIEVDAARATDRGFEHDRRWMVVDPAGGFFTQRSHPRLATIWTDLGKEALSLAAPDVGEVEVPLEAPDAASMRVRVWNSVVDAVPVSAQADAWLSDYLGTACRLVYMPESTQRFSNPTFAGAGQMVGFADGYAYLIIGEASLADLALRLTARNQKQLPMNRFRPNIVLAGSPAYAEDGFKDITVGEARLRAVKPCGRCEVTTTDQSTGEVRGPEPLATLGTYRNSDEFGVMFGMNLVTLHGGMVRVGDAVEIA